MDTKYLAKLKEVFGYDNFRDKQLNIIKTLLGKRDVCAIMFTGAGKSLCFQFPPIFTQKLAIVVSPLISLMNDQCIKMKEKGVPACCINSEMDYRDKLKVLQDVQENKYRLMYTTPETLIKQKNLVTKLHNDGILLLVAVDEAHCCSSWGNDFRLDYKKLSCLKEWCPDLPIITLTATATEIVQEDIINSLQLDNPLIVKTTFNRDNLFISVRTKTDDPLNDIVPLIVEPNNKPVIVYCGTRANTDKITALLKSNGIICDSYHAGMEAKDKDMVHNKFVNKEIDCVVATVAFGMGIDKPIRTVIHYCVPMDIESYYQEIGRAGRDGILSSCILFKSNKDLQTDHFIINQVPNDDLRDYKMILLSSIKKFISTVECRRKIILEYFGEKYKLDNCAMCDNCLNETTKLVCDFTKEAKLLLSVIKATGNCYGAGMICDILKGSKSSKILKKYTQIDEYGKGKDKKMEWWKIFMDMLINHGFVKQNTITGGRGCILSLTNEGNRWIIDVNKNPDKKLRLTLPEEMRKYHSETVEIPEKQEKQESTTKTSTGLLAHKSNDSIRMFNAGKSIDEISKIANVKPITIEGHLIAGYENGLAVDVTKAGLEANVISTIKEILIKNPNEKLSVIKNKLPNATYLQIKLVKAIIANESNTLVPVSLATTSKKTMKVKQPKVKKQTNKTTKTKTKTPTLISTQKVHSGFSSEEDLDDFVMCDAELEEELWEQYNPCDFDDTYKNLLDKLKKNLNNLDEDSDFEILEDDVNTTPIDEIFYESD